MARQLLAGLLWHHPRQFGQGGFDGRPGDAAGRRQAPCKAQDDGLGLIRGEDERGQGATRTETLPSAASEGRFDGDSGVLEFGDVTAHAPHVHLHALGKLRTAYAGTGLKQLKDG